MNRYLIPAFFLLLSVGLYIRYIDPYYAAVTAGQARIAEYDKLLTDARTANEKLAQLKKTEESFPVGYRTSLDTILPESVDPLRLVIDTNGIAALRGLQVKSPLFDTEDGRPGSSVALQENTFTFTVSAPYAIFRLFLRDLESSLALHDLSGLTFTSMESSDIATVSGISPELRAYDYEIKVTTYSLPK
jgi:hypothetical protein